MSQHSLPSSTPRFGSDEDRFDVLHAVVDLVMVGCMWNPHCGWFVLDWRAKYRIGQMLSDGSDVQPTKQTHLLFRVAK